VALAQGHGGAHRDFPRPGEAIPGGDAGGEQE